MPLPFDLEGLPVLDMPETAFKCCGCQSEHYPCKNCFPNCGDAFRTGPHDWPRIENYTDTLFQMPDRCAPHRPEWRRWDGFFRYSAPNLSGAYCSWYLTRGNDPFGPDPLWSHNGRLIYNAWLEWFANPIYGAGDPNPTWWFSFSCDGLTVSEVWIGKLSGGTKDPRGVYSKVAGSASLASVTIGSGTLPP